jgi:hypothetical protein
MPQVKAMGSIPKNFQKYFTRIFIPYGNDQGKHFGVQAGPPVFFNGQKGPSIAPQNTTNILKTVFVNFSPSRI